MKSTGFLDFRIQYSQTQISTKRISLQKRIQTIPEYFSQQLPYYEQRLLAAFSSTFDLANPDYVHLKKPGPICLNSDPQPTPCEGFQMSNSKQINNLSLDFVLQNLEILPTIQKTTPNSLETSFIQSKNSFMKIVPRQTIKQSHDIETDLMRLKKLKEDQNRKKAQQYLIKRKETLIVNHLKSDISNDITFDFDGKVIRQKKIKQSKNKMSESNELFEFKLNKSKSLIKQNFDIQNIVIEFPSKQSQKKEDFVNWKKLFIQHQEQIEYLKTNANPSITKSSSVSCYRASTRQLKLPQIEIQQNLPRAKQIILGKKNIEPLIRKKRNTHEVKSNQSSFRIEPKFHDKKFFGE